MNFEIVAFVVYFVAVLGIGVYCLIQAKGQESEEDYFIGGRKMGPFVTAMSAQASDMSGWLLMGLPGSILAFGLGKAWIAIGLSIGTIVNWLFTAKRLRKFSKAYGNSITLPEYLQNRFYSKNHVLSVLCAVVFLVAFTIYVASGFVAGATVFTSLVPSLSTELALIIFAAVVLLYTFMGGYRAVCYTDFFQGILMLLALVSVPIIIVATEDIDTAKLAIDYTNVDDGTVYSFTTNVFSASWQEIVSGLAWGLGYFGMPHILVRFMGIEKPSMIKKSASVAIVWVIITLTAALLLAYFGRIVIGAELLPNGAQETVFIVLARRYFPAFISGMMLAAIIAASMSTVDSQMLVASSSFTNDIYKPLIRKNASEKELLWVGRGLVVLVSVVAYFIASSKGHGATAIMNMVEQAWGLFGASFGPVIILSLCWKRFNQAGAIGGILAGAAVNLIWYNLLTDTTGVYELFPGFVAGLLCAVVVTLCTKAPSEEVLASYEVATDDSIDD